MTDSVPSTPRSSESVRNLTKSSNYSAPGTPVYGGLSLEEAHDNYELPIRAPPTVLTPRNQRRPTTPSRSEEHRPLYRQTHRRSKTEAVSLPASPITRTKKQVDNAQHTRSASGLEDIDLESKPDQDARPNSARSGKLFGGWLQGESESPSDRPITVSTSPSQGTAVRNNRLSADLSQMAQAISIPGAKLHRRMTSSSPLKQVTSTNPFSFFTSKAQEPKSHDLPEPADDKFLNLDIGAALFPSGSHGPSSPDAVKTLQDNAEKLIRELQSAYKVRTFALHEALAEKTEQGEELEETRSRLQNIKSQLDGMAEKVLEQDKAMKKLAEELKFERQRRQEEAEYRQRSATLVQSSEHIGDEHSLEVISPKRHAKRSSGATFNSDSGFDSGDESTTESIFSRRNDTVYSPSIITRASGASSPDILSPRNTLPPVAQAHLPPSKPTASAPPQKQSTYDKVIKGISSGSFIGSSPFSFSKCSNCHGATASEAWNVVSILKEESKGLKTRISDLECAVEECITLVGG
ncbi:hypothetical protein AJ80_07571 [Polytolypa hystricis UAMH7299]|uniref:Uncharacterized protein n=1 Tax=Polytolypa hystricis (strain UAMH7299) TaxID=1447883 RepID=A0A2B7XMX5_POLH7|nr:hypothetical protein AJ80_07571 [Polytolypa hystricis UAMH7299]